MTFLLKFTRRQWLKRVMMLVLGAIATSLLLLIGIPLVDRAVALTVKPFSGTPAPKLPTLERIVSLVDQDRDRLVEIFKDIHQNPELGFMEVRTAGIVAKELKALGYEVKTGIGKTGVVGILRNGDGPTVMYRADMDANAVEEDTGLPYSSTVRVQRGDGEEVPVAHLCGHDAHVTWMLGVAKAMVELKDKWSGTLILVGQPAEEPVQGAVAMVRDGLYTKYGVPKPDYLVGLHTTPIRTGAMAVIPGDINAGTDQLDVTFHGIGGHGSSPHLAKDPVLMASTAVVQYQFIVSRAIDPLRAAVITVGSVQAGTDNNVIPASALVKINLRWYDEADRQLMLDGIERINQSIAAAYNLPAELRPTTVMKGGAKVLSNDAEMAATLTPPLQSFLGEKAVITNAPKVMGSEDFHHLVIENENPRYLYRTHLGSI
jgi:hippurate hydrolase